MKLKFIIAFGIFCLLANIINAQNITQNIKGKVIDKESQSSLIGASVVVAGTNPIMGASSDIDGNYFIKKVPIGRYTIKISYIGYEDMIINEVLIGSGKEVVLNASLKEKVINSKEIVFKANKYESINSMVTLSARQLSVEEASRYAGGFDDPSRLASSFAGVSGNLGTNGVVIRGNAPKGLLWCMEGVEITNPSHFANVSSLGAGAITALSSQMLSNSDFITGAFPSEYGNALSGVFDIKLRNGNNEKREYTIQAGLVGIDLSSEGPFVKGKKASYLFNYRYSTFGLLAPVLPSEMGVLKYQDLSFKLNFPTQKYGIFSVWGIGALDYQGRNAINDSNSWKSDIDKQQYSTDLYMSALGINHKIILGNKTYINTSLAATGNGLSLDQKEYISILKLMPSNKIDNYTWKYSLTSFVNHKFSANHTNKTGIIISRLLYNMNVQKKDNNNMLINYVNDKGSSYLMQAYSQSKYDITNDLTFNIGLHSQLFLLNNHYTVEPRIGLRWNFNPRQTIGISYGLHSQLEMLNFYFVQQQTSLGITEPNKNLDFSKAHHIVFSYDIKLTENAHLKFEPYYQFLFNIPVIPSSYYSLQNLENGIYFNDSLVNKGKGSNIGIDITFERFLNKGYYYLATASIFNSKYKGGDGIERNARFNKNYVVNLLGGKEWNVGRNKNNILNINAKLCLMGGDYYNPLNYSATYASQDIVENESKAFTLRKKDAQILSLSASYRINKLKHSSIWAISFINVLGYKEANTYYFDKTSNSIKQDVNQIVMPNFSYKLEF
ncbi:MAG: TonB-dependent receptor [Bacteroidetes bacterium]|nr:TonB-dependent receptor [Bacteroidota bacterium]